MKQIFKYDTNGKFSGDTLIIYPDEKGIYTIPIQYTDIELPQPNWKPVFKDGKWLETITKKELDELYKPIPQPLSVGERLDGLERDNADLWFGEMLRDSKLQAQDEEIADLWYSVMIGGAM